MKMSLLELLASITSNMRQPIKFVEFYWQVSPAFSAGSYIATFSPSTSNTNGAKVPDGYKFICWIQLTSVNWVGSLYTPDPVKEACAVWTVTAKAASSDHRIVGTAMYIREDLA